MKKILALILGLSMNAHAFIGNVGHSTALDYAKAVIPETVEKQFVNVKAAAIILAGQVAALDLTADDGATVVLGTTTGLAPMCIMVNDCAVGALCKCQTYGLFDSALFDVTAASAVAGKRVWMATGNAGYIAARGTELATEIPLGFFYDASSVSGALQIFIKL